MLKLSIPVDHEDERPVVNDNISLLTDIMTYSPYGALSQAFVVEAIMAYADEIIKAKPEDLVGNPLVSAQAWQGVARDIHRRMTEFYDRHNKPEGA